MSASNYSYIYITSIATYEHTHITICICQYVDSLSPFTVRTCVRCVEVVMTNMIFLHNTVYVIRYSGINF